MALTPRLLGRPRESFINRNLRRTFQMSVHVRSMSPDYSKQKKKKVARVALCHMEYLPHSTKDKKDLSQLCSSSKLHEPGNTPVCLLWIKYTYISTSFKTAKLLHNYFGEVAGWRDDLPRVYLATCDIGHPICLHIIVYNQELEGFIGCCWTDSCCVWLLTRGLITTAWEGHYLWAAAIQLHDTVPNNNRSNGNGVTNNDLSCSILGLKSSL